MTPLASSVGGAAFDIDGIHFYALGNNTSTLYFIPSAPVPERDGQNRPTLMLLRTAQTSILQLGVQFTIPDADQSAARGKIAAARPEFASVRLQPAPVTVTRVAVLLARAAGGLVELKSAASSGYPPFTTVFSISLTSDQVPQAAGAIGGRSGLLFVEYSLALPDNVAATIVGTPSTLTRRTDIASWFPGGSGASHVLPAG